MNDNYLITVNKEELYDLLCDFNNTEDKIHNLCVLLNVLSEHYYHDIEQPSEIHSIICILANELQMMRNELRRTLNRVDEYLNLETSK